MDRAFEKYFAYAPTTRRLKDYHCLGELPAERSCTFNNLCFAPSNRSWLFYQEKGITALPYNTYINARNEVSWYDESIFSKNWHVALESAYNHRRSKYEGEPGFFFFKSPTVINGPIYRSDSTPPIFIESPYMLFSRSHHDDNAGHLIFDTYHPLLTAINSHIGMHQAKNVTTVDLVWNNQIFSRWSQVFDKKWKIFIGNVLLKRQIHFRDFLAENRAALRDSALPKKQQVVCYRKLIVGCGRLSGLDGQTLHRRQSINYIRTVLWTTYAPISEGGIGNDKDNLINILMLEKNSSSWQHSNYITNWKEIVNAVSELPSVKVTNYSPEYVSFKAQIQGYRNADIVISLWGGISMLNFLLRPGRVEIVITSWFEDNNMMPLPNRTQRSHEGDVDLLECPDFDSMARMSQDIKQLRYCTRDNGHTPNHIRLHNFIPLVKKAVKYIEWKKQSGFS